MAEGQPILAHISQRSVEDPDFRARLIADPQATLEGDMGLIFPDGVEVEVVENSRTKYTIAIPSADTASSDQADDVVGFGNIYHIPEWNRALDLKLGDIQRPEPGKLGFGSNPFKVLGDK